MRKYKHKSVKNSYPSSNIEADKNLVHSLSKTKIPNLKQLKYIGKYLGKREAKVLKIAFLVLLFSLSFSGVKFYRSNVKLVPVQGGEYTEGLVGSPRFINPIYASASDVDSDITKLVFSSLFTHDKNGQLTPDLATEYEVSEDNKEYTIKIRNDAKWHNGDPLTVYDVIYTFNTIKDPNYKSPLRNSFLGVKIEQVDEEKVKFILEEPYAAFLEFLTFGIIPEIYWMQIPPETASLAELNLKPIGSGPYKFKSLVKDKAGNIKSYNLVLNEDYYGKNAYIDNITFKFFLTVDELVNAINEKTIDGAGYLPRYAKENIVSPASLDFHELNLPLLTAIFFNQKNNKNLENFKIRKALALAINKDIIVNDIFQGDVVAIDGPILPNNFAYKEDIKKYTYNQEEAEKLIRETGWIKQEITEEAYNKAQEDINSKDESTSIGASADNEVKANAEKIVAMGPGTWLYNKKENNYLIIKLTTVDNEDNVNVVAEIQKQWEQIGVKTEINIVTTSEIQANVIKPRNFEALFYGQVVGNDPDIYVFWHSSQIGENGLNISNYDNSDVDKLLEEARLIANREERIQKYQEFQEKIVEDLPAIFMYSPLYTYVQSHKVQGFDIESILKSSDRFDNITDWYIKTGKKIVW